jgi:hypothetical protein
LAVVVDGIRGVPSLFRELFVMMRWSAWIEMNSGRSIAEVLTLVDAVALRESV